MSPRRWGRGDAGAALLEAAIALPILFVLIFGIMEVGSLLGSYSGASNAVRAGGRMASVAGAEAMADQQILRRMAQEAAGVQGDLEYVIIWNASGPGEKPPPACVSIANGAIGGGPNTTWLGSQGGAASPPNNSRKGACNVYIRPDAPGGAFAMARGEVSGRPAEWWFGCTGPGDPDASHKLDCAWPPQSRKVEISPRTETDPSRRRVPDHAGVHLRVKHEAVTHIMGASFTITDNGINMLEPDNYGVGS